jgi:1-deoxy-D-xylulose-5-phosphate reductoisomerase
MKNISILGSTGSIGRNTLKVISKMADRFHVTGLSAGANLKLFTEQIELFKPAIVSVKNQDDAEALQNLFKGINVKITYGPEGTEEVAAFPDNDIIVSAITGISGLRPTMAAVQTGKRVALANKEAMVTAGALIQKSAEKSGAEIIPVDSEHSGVFQCIRKEKTAAVNRVMLTASGGPFFRMSPKEIRNQSVSNALNHPRWKMGKKISIDSATMMNKGLEIIEAKWLFDLSPRQLDILIHPQSIVHSLVEMKDGSVIAQLSRTDMKIPIQYALTYPERTSSLLPFLNLVNAGPLEFYEADQKIFPLVALAFQALREKPYFSIAMNAANEIAVQEFLYEKLSFSGIWETVIDVMNQLTPIEIQNLEELLAYDREVREKTRNIIKQRE